VQLRLGQIVNFDFGRGIKGKSAYVMPVMNKGTESYEKVRKRMKRRNSFGQRTFPQLKCSVSLVEIAHLFISSASRS